MFSLGWVSAGLALTTATALVGCESSTSERPDDPVATSTAAAPASPEAGVPKVVSSYRASCADGRTNSPPRAPAENDLVLGTARFAGGLIYAEHRGGLQPDGTHFFKTGAEMSKGAAPTTITVPREAKPEVALLFEHADGYPQQVRIESCPRRDTWFVSGFILLQTRSACVPLDVQVRGRPKQRVIVSLGAGRC